MPTPPTTITSFPVGNPSGQKPAVVVRDVTNGWDLYTRDADAQSLYPASCVKLMTLLLAWEQHESDWTTGTVTVNSADIAQPSGMNISMAGLQNGDVLTWEDLAYAMMLPSGGDAAKAIARVIGDELTASGGVARFVTEMNTKASALGLTNSTFVDPFGGSKTFSPDTVRNVMSARDLATLCWEALSIDDLLVIAGSASHGLSISGPHARTQVVNNVVALINGPSTNPVGITDDGVLGAKSGAWELPGNSIHQYNLTTLWLSPNGTQVVITTLGSLSTASSLLDQRGLIYSLLRDFPHLTDGVEAPDSDPYWADVVLLVAGGLTDESPVGRAVTTTSVVSGDPIVAGSSGSILFDGTSDDAHCTDGPDLAVGSGNLTVETWYCGPGSVPSREYVFGIKAGATKEWAFNYYNGGFNIFASSNGSSWTNTVAYWLASIDQAVFFNGATRHLALVKSGSTWTLYINGEKMPATISVGTPYDGSNDLSVGKANVNPSGRLDDYRVTGGVARYTASMVTLDPRKCPRG